MQLAGRVALVTGGGSGIGLAVAQHLADRGMRVALAGRSRRVTEAALQFSQPVLAMQADVRNSRDVDAAVERTEAELGPIWLLVNCAGVLPVGTAMDASEDDWDLAFDVIAKGTFLCCRAAAARMALRHGGRIVNVSSISSTVARSGQIAYCSAKAAVNHFTRCLAMEVAEYGVTVNAVLPGSTVGEALMGFMARRGLEPEALAGAIPTGRLADPEDHAALVAFLASDEAAHITGQLIAVDGGQSQFMPFR